MTRAAPAGGRPPLRPLLRDDAAFARLVPRPRSAPMPTNRNESRRVAYTSRRNTVTSAVNCGSRPRVASRYGKSVGDVEIVIGVVKEPWDLGLCPKPEGQARRFMIMHKAD